MDHQRWILVLWEDFLVNQETLYFCTGNYCTVTPVLILSWSNKRWAFSLFCFKVTPGPTWQQEYPVALFHCLTNTWWYTHSMNSWLILRVPPLLMCVRVCMCVCHFDGPSKFYTYAFDFASIYLMWLLQKFMIISEDKLSFYNKKSFNASLA